MPRRADCFLPHLMDKTKRVAGRVLAVNAYRAACVNGPPPQLCLITSALSCHALDSHSSVVLAAARA
ncbi:hypothetical protein E2C01_050531 [Portunus trituberculatus]|uniref:Uncharacterized protein n=1 Tax=Portunus trituberculatus TaxID=210409 RepID=A0A5B7G8J5_PORTR|nr:hypothetical protein [Portunus trituberculatus]